MTTTPNYCKVCKTYYTLPHMCRHDVGTREKEMPAKELVFGENYVNIKFVSDDKLIIKIDVPMAIASLNRAEAHLLYLYLKERFEPK